MGRWARKPVNHTSWVAVVTPTDRPKSVRNRCLIELFCGVVCVVTLPFWHFCWCMGFCHRTESDLFLFLFMCCKLTASPFFVCRTLFTPCIKTPFIPIKSYIYARLWYRWLVDTREARFYRVMDYSVFGWLYSEKVIFLPQNLQNEARYKRNFARFPCRQI